MNKTTLSGIKPTGVPHVGNYFGSIKPNLEKASENNMASYLFVADYHALNQIKDPAVLKQCVREIACTWLACGLDPKKTVFYRQSDVPEVLELAIILTGVTPKGLLNRAHAYKAIVQAASEDGRDPDSDVNVGLYFYPILMAADILMFDTNFVPVGQDQKQHIEIAGDIAKAFNATYGQTLTVPEAVIKKEVAIVPGIDGRKMSKSYGNQIPLFAEAGELKKAIMRIVTDSTSPQEPKSIEHPIFQIYKLLATDVEAKAFAKRFSSGIGWGEAKAELLRVAEREFKPLRERYNYFINNFDQVEKILQDGAKKARVKAREVLRRVRTAIGAGESL